MLKKIPKYGYFLLAWFLLNLVQALFTEITNDEAYYALYGQHLAWGYFDHPPMVALLTHFSSVIFQGNLSARFLTILMTSATLLIVWRTIEVTDKQRFVVPFFVLASSMPMMNAYGFIVTPDVPLLFFGALFLYFYKRFLKEENLSNISGLILAMTGMLYSKYHAVLVIGLIVLSNFSLLRRPKFRLSLLMTLILFLPHLLWQWTNDFPTFKYHLVERSKGFEWKYLLEYLPNQLAVFNPLTLAIVVWILIKYKSLDVFERGLYFLITGFLLFFGLMSLRGHVEPHWTMAASLGMLILVIQKSAVNKKLLHFIVKFIPWTLILILFARILLTTSLLPDRLAFHGKEKKYEAINSVAGEFPVIFKGSFQNPSLYIWFTGGKSHVDQSTGGRMTQFDLWRLDKNFDGKMVFYFGNEPGKSLKYKVDEYEFEGYFGVYHYKKSAQ